MTNFQSLVVGVTGLSGSGKSYFVQRLTELFNDQVCVLGFDDYYKPLNEQIIDLNGEANYDLTTALKSKQFEEDLLKLIQGHPITIRKYQFEDYDAPETTQIIEPKKLIIVEGIFVLSIPEIDQWIDYRIFIEADTQLCYTRRLERDTVQRNIPRERSHYQWSHHVIPAYNEFIVPHKVRCNSIVLNDEQFEQSCNLLAQDLKRQFNGLK